MAETSQQRTLCDTAELAVFYAWWVKSELKTDAIDYAMRFMSNAPRIWSNASIEYQIIYQRLVFPEGIEYDLSTNKFRTPKLSALYTLASMKKDPSMTNESLLVTLRGSAWNTIWPSMEMLYVKLGELGIDDECILKGDNHGKI